VWAMVIGMAAFPLIFLQLFLQFCSDAPTFDAPNKAGFSCITDCYSGGLKEIRSAMLKMRIAINSTIKKILNFHRELPQPTVHFIVYAVLVRNIALDKFAIVFLLMKLTHSSFDIQGS
jgi:hypothetical protein